MATLSASYSGASTTPHEIRFEYGTSQSSLTNTAYYNNGDLKAPEGSFSVTVGSLKSNTLYYYRAVIQFGEVDYTGEVKSFRTAAEQGSVVTAGWLELPAPTSGSDLFSERLGSGKSRNYSYLYDKAHYGTLWAAYPLTASDLSGSASSSWSFNPGVDQDCQINVKSSSYGSNYGNSLYNRGHLVPNGDRNDSGRVKQVFYLTNQSPQVGNSFNGSVWSNLETNIRSLTNQTDTVYVVTGVAFQTVGGNETVSYLNAASADIKPSCIPVPNYFWKALLKVKRTNGTVTSASAVAFWFENKSYPSGTAFSAYAVPVDRIEQLTGFDLFANLPDNLETGCETNTSWETFKNF